MFEKLISKQIFKKLESMTYGSLSIMTPDGHTQKFEGTKEGEKADIIIKHWSVISNMAQKGDIGLAEDYRADNWETSDLTALITLALQNKKSFDSVIMGNALSRIKAVMSYLFKSNTVQGSKKNIHAHYDLGNEFYKLWLDPSMTYSSALYKTPNDTLLTAQDNKYDRILEQLNSTSGNILEIGCGWGGFAKRALSQGDYDIKGITLSDEQHDFANEQLGQDANIVIEDYRHQTGKFDHIISIEMFEAVGERYWKTYFDKISDLLHKNGRAVIQTITMNDADFPRYRKGADFIRSYIFPGGMLPSPSRFRKDVAKSGLRAENEFYFGHDYARTLGEWLKIFDEKKPEIKALGFDDGFIRLWRFYLAGCIAGFTTGQTDVMQVELVHA